MSSNFNGTGASRRTTSESALFDTQNLPASAVDETASLISTRPRSNPRGVPSELLDDHNTHQRIELEDGMTAVFTGYKDCRWKLALYWPACVLTGGILFLLTRWMVSFRLKLTAELASLEEATMLFIENSWDDKEVQLITSQYHGDDVMDVFKALSQASSSQPTNAATRVSAPLDGHLRRLSYRCMSFVYSPLSKEFIPLSDWNDSTRPVTTMHLGLDRHLYVERKTMFGVNSIAIPEKSTARLLVDEVLHPFYIFQVFSILLWCAESYYYYAGCIFVISTLSSVLSLRETKANLRRMREMSRFECSLRVLRSGVWIYSSSEDLLPGDVYEVSCALESFPCDSLLLTGDCIVNESMLTGESIPVFKTPAQLDTMPFSNDVDKLEPKHVLFCGTHIIRARSPAVESDGIQQLVMALVLRTGFNTMKGTLIRSIMFPKPSSFQFYQDSFRFVGIMAIIAGLGFVFSFVSFLRSGVSWFLIIIRASDLITIVVPPALPAAMSVGTNFSLGRLKKRNIYCISPPRINVCGKVNIMVFDKTGTLTEDGLDVLGVQAVSSESARFLPLTLKTPVEGFHGESVKNCSLLHGLVTCHSLKKLDGHLVGDPLDLKMFEFTNWLLEESDDRGVVPTIVRPPGSKGFDIDSIMQKPDGHTDGNKKNNHARIELGVIRCFEFISGLRRMSVITKQLDSGGIFTYAKGAPEVIKSICTPQSMPLDYEVLLNQYTRDGYRVIALAGKCMMGCTWLQAQKMKRAAAESDLEFLGFVVFENKLKPETQGALSVLARANIRDVMCTGDNLLTAISVGKSCHLVDALTTIFVPSLVTNTDGDASVVWESMDDNHFQLDPISLLPLNPLDQFNTISAQSSQHGSTTEVFGDVKLSSQANIDIRKEHTVITMPQSSRYSDSCGDFALAVTGEVFDFIMERYPITTQHRMLVKADVFARMSPDQKHVLVEQLQLIGYCVGMCGDGANDCGALKAANVGISLSEAEASVAAPFTSRTTNIECVLVLLREGRAALVTSFSCFEYIALYSMIQFCSVSLLYTLMSTLGDFQFLFIDLVLILPIAVFMGRTEASERIHIKRPTAKLVSRKVLLPLLGQMLLQIAFQLYVFLTVSTYSWYTKPNPNPDETNIMSYENTSLFLVSCFQYLIGAVVFSVGPPYRKGMSSNKFLIISLLLLTGLCVFFLTCPSAEVSRILELEPLPFHYRAWLMFVVLVNLIMSMIFERMLFPRINAFISDTAHIKHQHDFLTRHRPGVGHIIMRWLGLPRLKTNRKQFKTILEDYNRSSS